MSRVLCLMFYAAAVGAKGALLADALAAPAGTSAVSAVVIAQSLNEPFVWAMLQTASVADGAPPELALSEVVMVRWVGHSKSDSATDAELVEIEDEESGSDWLGRLSFLPTVGCARGQRPRVGTRELPEGLNRLLDEKIRERCKPRIGVAHSVFAESTVQHGHGQCHSKLWMLHFKPFSKNAVEKVRLVISSGNATPGSYGGAKSRPLCGLWWADFECTASTPRQSEFRDTLQDHVEQLLASRRSGGCGTWERAHATWVKMRAAWDCADCSPADSMGTMLVSHTPGIYPSSPTHGGLAKGMSALRNCSKQAMQSADEQLDLAIIVHSCSGWSSGGDGAARFREWCAVAAPNGGQVRFYWPDRHDSTVLGSWRTQRAGAGFQDCKLPEWLKVLPIMKLQMRKDVIRENSETGYMCTPHLMLYVWHEPIKSPADTPSIRRMLLTSANLSAAAWGYSREGALEIRSFELGVCVRPEFPEYLVEPFGDVMIDGHGNTEIHARAIPFQMVSPSPCPNPYVGRALVVSSDTHQVGQLNY